MPSDSIRLQKFLSERGVASRRHAAKLIEQGFVTVNGDRVTEPGRRVDPTRDTVLFRGRALPQSKEATRTILLYKPRGYVCSTRGQKSPTVYDLIEDVPERLVPAGRLDKDSEGLLLMSNDGDLVNRLTHPRHGHAKTYHVTVAGTVDACALKKLRSRLVIDGYRIRPAKVRILKLSSGSGYALLEFVLKEGRNRQVRKMCSAAGLRVHRLLRVAIGSITAAGLRAGEWRDLGQALNGK